MFDTSIAREEILPSSAGQGEMRRVATSEERAFCLEHPFPKGDTFTVGARFAGADLYLPSKAEASIDVLIITNLTLESPGSVDVERPAVFSWRWRC